jgi:crotonobetainyl-CoA:carnitine CoA-transferase CaiB-like acyl-CoA transferase
LPKITESRNPFLTGVDVLDFTQVLSGPYCTQLLADLGARVTKVEPRFGDSTRQWGPPFQGGQSAYFLSLNRNKRSLAIDLSKGGSARQVALHLASRSQVLVENFRPGVMKKLGLGYESVTKVNPRIIYCSISGYGQYGPLSHKPGYDIAAFAASGIMSITGEERGEPVKVGVPVADIGAGILAALSIVSCLYRNAVVKIPRSVHLDVSMHDAMVSWLTFQAGYYFATGRNPKRLGSAHPILVPYQAFKARDRHFVLAVGNDSIWQRACESMGSNLWKDRRFSTVSARTRNRKILIPSVEKILAKKTASQWLRIFEEAGVPSSPISTVGEALNSSHSKARKLVKKIRLQNGEILQSISLPVAFNPIILVNYEPPPGLGEHTFKILSELGYSRRKINKLFASNAVFNFSKSKKPAVRKNETLF